MARFTAFILFLVLLNLCSGVKSQELGTSDFIASPPVPPENAISLDKAIDTALKSSPLLQSASHQVAGARANFSGQRAPLNPTISFAGINNTVTSINPGDLNNYSLYFTVETSGRMRWRSSQALAQLQGTVADAETTRLAVRQTVASAYIDLQASNQAVENERNAYGTALRLSELAEKQFQLGASSETNAIRARISLTQEEQNLIKAVNDVKLGRANLNVQLGRRPEELVDVSEPLAYRPMSFLLGSLYKKAMESRPEIRSSQAAKRALQALEELQLSQYFPDLTLGTSVKFNQLQLGLTLPLFDFGSIRGSVRKAREDVKAQESQTEMTLQNVHLDVENAHLTVQRAGRLVETFQDGILPRAESLLKRVESGYRLGSGTILDLIDAQQTYRLTRNNYYAAIGDYLHALTQLERAVGAPLSDK